MGFVNEKREVFFTFHQATYVQFQNCVYYSPLYPPYCERSLNNTVKPSASFPLCPYIRSLLDA